MTKIGLLSLFFLGVAGFGTVIAVAQDLPSTVDEVPQLPEEADQMVVSPSEAISSTDTDSGDDLDRPISEPAGPSRWMFNGGFGATADYVSGQATVGYYWVRYVGVESTYFYYQLNSERYFATQSGPEVDLMVRLYNPTMVTPLAGLGLGYSRWHRRFLGERFSEGGTFTGNVLFGLDIALSRHFGMQIIRKNTNYLGTPPISFTDRQSDEARSTWYTNIGFRVVF